MSRHPITADCVFCYRLDESLATNNAVDSSSNGYTLTQTGSPSVVAGIFNNARQFSLGKYLSRYDIAGILPSVATATVACWINWDGTLPTVGKYATIWDIKYGPYATKNHFMGITSAGKLRAYIGGMGGMAIFEVNITSGLHYITYTYKSGASPSYILYIDGSVAASYASSSFGNILTSTGGGSDSTMLVGMGDDSGTTSYFPGWVDDLAFYNTAKDINWINQRLDITGPTINAVNPTSGEIDVPISSSLSIDITDNTNIHASLTLIKIDGGSYSNTTIWTGDGAAGPFTGARSSIIDGYNYLLNHSVSFDYNTTYTISIDAYDNALNNTHLDYNFDTVLDSTAPTITPVMPVNGETDFYPAYPIDLNITDSETGVNYLLTKIRLAGGGYSNTIIWSSDSATGGFSGTRSVAPDGYKYLLTNTTSYLPSTTYNILVDAYDYASNKTTFLYSFTSASAIIIYENEMPADISTGVATNSSISVDILTKSEVIIPSNIDAYVNGEMAFNGSFVYPFSGTISPVTIDGYDGYHLIINALVEYNNSSWITTNISVLDYYGFLSTTDWKFYTQTKLFGLTQFPYDITLEAEFSGPITITSDITNIINYSLSQPAYIRKIDVISPTILRFWVEYFFGVPEFTFECLETIQDSYGNSVITDPIIIIPFSSLANIGAGLLRTGHNENFIISDSQRIYIGGATGIDILKKERGITTAPWAQIYDEYGINALCVVNYPQDVIINDTIPPYISYNNPLNGSNASTDTHIVLVITDLITSVDITSLKVYLNDVIVFNGSTSGGFANNFTGYVSFTYKSLGIEFWPEIEFSDGELITVRVIAEDLLSNTMDQSYYFTIGESSFGLGYWGFIPFGV